jgi:hypothetical protein
MPAPSGAPSAVSNLARAYVERLFICIVEVPRVTPAPSGASELQPLSMLNVRSDMQQQITQRQAGESPSTAMQSSANIFDKALRPQLEMDHLYLC